MQARPKAADRLRVFTTRDGNAYAESSFNTLWQRIMAKAMAENFIPRRFTFHDLPAYYTTQHKNQYDTLPELHSNPATTARVYDCSRAVKRMGLG